MKKKVRLQDIALKLDLSVVTVSKALRGLYGVNEETRKKVLETARQLKYTGYSSETANALTRGVYCAMCDQQYGMNPHAMSLFFGLNQALQTTGSELIVMELGRGAQVDLDLKKLRNGGFRGVFLIGQGFQEQSLERLTGLSVPLVALDMDYPYLPIDCVMANDNQGAYLAVRHLMAKGHRDIGFIGDSLLAPSFRERYRGFLDALAYAKLNANPEFIHDLRFERPDGAIDFSCALDILDRKRQPTAYFCANDSIAETIHTGLAARKMTTGRDLSIIGFDNLNNVSWQRDDLTTIQYPRDEAAWRAAELMRWREENPGAGRQKLLIETKLVERRSVADLRR